MTEASFLGLPESLPPLSLGHESSLESIQEDQSLHIQDDPASWPSIPVSPLQTSELHPQPSEDEVSSEPEEQWPSLHLSTLQGDIDDLQDSTKTSEQLESDNSSVFRSYTIAQLKQLARRHGLRFPKAYRKEDMINHLLEAGVTPSDDGLFY